MAKVFFKTFGCTLNFSDTEFMMGILKDAGFEIVHKSEYSDVIIINSCAVKKPAEKKFFRYLSEMKGFEKPIIIAGCIAQVMPEKLKGYSLLGTANIANILKITESAMQGNTMVMTSDENNLRLNLPKVRKNKIIEIIPICSGCLGECSYCIVKRARGGFFSYEKREIIRQAESAVRDGVKEIWLTAQDTGCYGKDIGSSLPELLKSMVKIPGKFFIRVGMMNPNHALAMVDELLEVYKHEKIFKFLHIPVQSGSDEVLKKMRRKYTAADFKNIIKRFKEEIPMITIATDIICGFPQETEEQFKNSSGLVSELRPDVLNISKFWPRPKTEASKMLPLSGKEIKNRSRHISCLFGKKALEENKKWLDWEGHILIDEKGKNDSWVGRNFAYRPVIVKGNYQLGQMIRVMVKKATIHDLRAVET